MSRTGIRAGAVALVGVVLLVAAGCGTAASAPLYNVTKQGHVSYTLYQNNVATDGDDSDAVFTEDGLHLADLFPWLDPNYDPFGPRTETIAVQPHAGFAGQTGTWTLSVISTPMPPISDCCGPTVHFTITPPDGSYTLTSQEYLAGYDSSQPQPECGGGTGRTFDLNQQLDATTRATASIVICT